MRILKVSSARIDKIGKQGYTKFTLIFEDSSKLSKLEEYRNNLNNCLISRIYKNTGSLEEVINKVLVFNTINNDNYINLDYNCSAISIINEIKKKSLEGKYTEFDDYYFDVVQYFADNKSSVIYKFNNMLLTKSFQKSVLYNIEYNSKEIVNPFNIEHIYTNYYKDLVIIHENYDNHIKSRINLVGGRIVEFYDWSIEKHLKFVTKHKENNLVITGMTIKESIDLATKIKLK